MNPMKMFAGNHYAYSMRLSVCFSLLFCLMLTVPTAHARLTTEVDRNDIALGETLRLIIRADDGERPDEVDISALDLNFDILQRSSSTSAKLINGSQSVTRTLELELSPKRDGILSIPSLTAGGVRTTPIAIKVSPQVASPTGDALVYFTAEVDRTEVYVQAQLLLTVTLQQAISLDNRAVSDLDIADTFVKQLEQRSFQRRISGRLWQVTELRYAVFPDQSGGLEIPSMSFSGREILPGRSLLGARLGRRIAIDTNPIKITVKPVPQSFPGDVWLPAKQLTLTDSWSTAPEKLSVGDSTTRILQLDALGLLSSQLPPITSTGSSNALNGIRFYPDQETLEDKEAGADISSVRLQSEAVVTTTPGNWQLPALSVPWWNTETDALEYAQLPSRAIKVASPIATQVTPEAVAAPMIEVDTPLSTLWLLMSASGWLCAAILAYLLWHSKQVNNGVVTQSKASVDPAKLTGALVSLRLACKQNDASAARSALIIWAKLNFQLDDKPTIARIRGLASPALSAAMDGLDRALFSEPDEVWQGDILFTAARDQAPVPDTKNTAEHWQLYPSAG